MQLVPLNTLFEIEYGNKFDLKNMIISKNRSIAFVGRTAKNNGVVDIVDEINAKPYPAGLITVNLGGAILESFVQTAPFYTAQNVAVLKPRVSMSEIEKLYYCFAIRANKFRYGAFGREANRTLRTLLVPSVIAKKFFDLKVSPPLRTSASGRKVLLLERKWKWFTYEDLFDIQTGQGPLVEPEDKGREIIPFISTTAENNGISYFYDKGIPMHSPNSLTVSNDGSVGEAFFQERPFSASYKVNVLKPKFNMNKYSALFLTTLMRKEKYRYSYGRKWGLERMKESKINLPVDNFGKPDWQFMEDYIKSLPYSASI